MAEVSGPDALSVELRALTRSDYEGDFTFTIEGETFDSTKNDVILVNRGEVYSFKGKGKYLVINGPAFQSGDDIYTDGVKR